MISGSYEYFKNEFENNNVDPMYDPNDLLLYLLREITSNENNENSCKM